jgi:hypothetical protein
VRARLLRSQSRGPVAHLVERRHGMAKVVGSIPIGSTAARRRAPALRGNRFDPGREKSRPEPSSSNRQPPGPTISSANRTPGWFSIGGLMSAVGERWLHRVAGDHKQRRLRARLRAPAQWRRAEHQAYVYPSAQACRLYLPIGYRARCDQLERGADVKPLRRRHFVAGPRARLLRPRVRLSHVRFAFLGTCEVPWFPVPQRRVSRARRSRGRAKISVPRRAALPGWM